MVTVVQGKVCAKNHPDRLSRLATIHQRYRRTDERISYEGTRRVRVIRRNQQQQPKMRPCAHALRPVSGQMRIRGAMKQPSFKLVYVYI